MTGRSSATGSSARRTRSSSPSAATYVADLRDPLLDGAAYVTYVRSTMAHATITGDRHQRGRRRRPASSPCSPADRPRPRAAVDRRRSTRRSTRPLLATDTVRFVGEPVAVVVTERARTRARTPPSWSSSTTTRCRSSSTPRTRSTPTPACLPRRRHQHVSTRPCSACRSTDDASSTAARSSCSGRSSTSASPPCPLEVPRRGGGVGRTAGSYQWCRTQHAAGRA